MSGEEDRLEWVAISVVSEEHVADKPEYHLTVNVEVPPVQEADNVAD